MNKNLLSIFLTLILSLHLSCFAEFPKISIQKDHFVLYPKILDHDLTVGIDVNRETLERKLLAFKNDRQVIDVDIVGEPAYYTKNGVTLIVWQNIRGEIKGVFYDQNFLDAQIISEATNHLIKSIAITDEDMLTVSWLDYTAHEINKAYYVNAWIKGNSESFPIKTSKESISLIDYKSAISISSAASFTGVQRKNIFLTFTDYINKLQWIPSPYDVVAQYYLFRNGQLLAIFPGSGPFYYEDHERKKDETDIYQLIAIDIFGNIGSPLFVILPD